MRLIADGVVDREGVAGLASRLGYSRRQLQRHLVAELGAGPLAVARAHRAQTARLLIESTDLPLARVAFAAGFGSTRQFNTTVREVFATTPGELRARAGRDRSSTPGEVTLHLPARAPFAGDDVLAFLGTRAVAGFEHHADGVFRRTLRLPHGPGIVTLQAAVGGLRCHVRLADLRDLGPAIQRCRRLTDLDADAPGIAEALGDDPVVGPTVRHRPGRRVPGTVDGGELAVRAVLGQQVSVPAAQRLTAALVAAAGDTTGIDDADVGLHFPTAAAARDAAAALRMPRGRRETVVRLASALAAGDLALDPGTDPRTAVDALAGIRGIGPWTTGYVAMRALADPDALPAGDAGVRRALASRGVAPDHAQAVGERWRPWRAYAVMHLWAGPTPSASET
jgi:AraC family transcriptional regulator of adaptative response / DNA-3-methyladenine glycosylase II